MQPLVPVFIGSYSKGLFKDKKPYLGQNDAFSDLQNAYVYRDSVKKRECLEIVGRLTRDLEAESLGVTVAAVNTITFANVFTTLGIIGENPEIKILSTAITIAAPDAATFTDMGDGTFTVTGIGVSAGSYIDYATGKIILQLSGIPVGGAAITINISYYPGLPVMGITSRELSTVNIEQTIFFDTKYAYKFTGGSFSEFILTAPNTWTGTDSDFFSYANFRGSVASSRLFFVTNFNIGDPIRYTDGTTWTDFAPIIADNPPSAAQSTLFQARILIPYYGRLLAFNTYEGLTADGAASAANFYNRCRYSQIGDPTQADAWRSDVFGKGGFIDAPTGEAIISVIFFKNTLIVGFERSTWQLRYVGEYGIPFIWERISSDFGTESTFSNVLFDKGVLSIGDKAIIISNGLTVQRIDLEIPDTVFGFKNANQGTKRIQGVRDFKRELVFWNYVDSTDLEEDQVFPNRVLVYNYRNETWAIFRDNVTAFGNLQEDTSITWDSLDIFWDDESTTWDDADEQSEFPFIVSGNQQGFIHKYGYKTPDDGSLSITGVDLTTTPIKLTIKNHNLETGEIIFIEDLQFIDPITFLPLSTDLNGSTYQVKYEDVDTISILKWNGTDYITNFSFTPITSAIYVGGGTVALDPVLYVQTKDFSPFMDKGSQIKMSYIDFLMDATPSALMTVELWLNSSMSVKGNLLIGNQEMETYLPPRYYVPNSDYAWHRFFATLAGQFIRIVVTYDNVLMNNLDTRNQTWRMNAMCLWCKPGGKNVF